MTLKFNSSVLLSSIVLFVLFLSSSCKDEVNPCTVNIEDLDFTLSDTIKEYVSNYNGANKVIFITSAGVEVAFAIERLSSAVFDYGALIRCEVDTTQLQSVNGSSEQIKLSLTNLDEFDKPIEISLIEQPDLNNPIAYESLKVESKRFFDGDYLFSFGVNNDNEFSTTHDSLELGGRMYYSVIETNLPTEHPEIDILYTKKEGIVLMRNIISYKEYYYDRVE